MPFFYWNQDDSSPASGSRRYSGAERRVGEFHRHVVPVRLTCKLADAIDGVDLTTAHVGDRLALPTRSATLLIAEGWAERVVGRGERDAAGRSESD